MATETGSRPRRSRGFWLALGCAAVSLSLLGCVILAIVVASVDIEPTPSAPARASGSSQDAAAQRQVAPTATYTPVPTPEIAWRVFVHSPDSQMLIKWECQRTDGERETRTEGVAVAGSEPSLMYEADSDKVFCAVSKRHPGTLVVSLYRGDQLEEEVTSNRERDRLTVYGS